MMTEANALFDDESQQTVTMELNQLRRLESCGGGKPNPTCVASFNSTAVFYLLQDHEIMKKHRPNLL